MHWLVEFDSMASVRCVVVIVKLYESWYWNVMLDSDVCQLVKQKEYLNISKATNKSIPSQIQCNTFHTIILMHVSIENNSSLK